MSSVTDQFLVEIRQHRVYSHPMFGHWARHSPEPSVIGAMFHQIQCFCASTRPGWSFPEGLRKLGYEEQAGLMEEIVESESGHGPELAMMAGHIVNRAAGEVVFKDLKDWESVEAGLKVDSDRILGRLPSYDASTGLTVQARRAIAIFDRRKRTDRESVLSSLGSALALEIISNQSLIPGEKLALIDSSNYGVTLEDPEMHYLKEHWGECGAEQQHERNVVTAIDASAGTADTRIIQDGVHRFVEALASLWDVIDASLLSSGYSNAA